MKEAETSLCLYKDIIMLPY